MDPRRLSELTPFLREHGLIPKKSLSQNFLIDANIVKKIVKTANLHPEDAVLEIGPGPGGLTKTLLEAGAKVVAIELDGRYASLLPQTLQHNNLTVIHMDFLKFIPSSPMTVIANIPYHITSPIIARLAEYSHLFPKIFLTVQKDMAERILAKKGSKQNNAFAIFVDFFFTPTIVFTIGKDCFYPKPKVNSALLSLIPKKEHLLSNPKPFFAFVRLLFQQKRKMIRSTLKNPNLTDLRPEMLGLEDFIHLFSFLKKENKLPPLPEE